jgi:maleylpyruvate isomerase
MSLVLHNYFRSSSSTRVRAALNLKGLAFDYIPHHLRKGEQTAPDYLKLNPQGLVPALQLESGDVLVQSLAIMEYLDEVHPTPALLPRDPVDRAYVRALALAIACEIHPINNLRVLGDIRQRFGADDEAVNSWFRHWVDVTFRPLEQTLATDGRRGLFCFGDEPGLADICILAQVINNKRFAVDMAPYPTLSAIYQNCLAVPAFAAALPDKQPDAE